MWGFPACSLSNPRPVCIPIYLAGVCASLSLLSLWCLSQALSPWSPSRHQPSGHSLSCKRHRPSLLQHQHHPEQCSAEHHLCEHHHPRCRGLVHRCPPARGCGQDRGEGEAPAQCPGPGVSSQPWLTPVLSPPAGFLHSMPLYVPGRYVCAQTH